jgi:hypothetical protein
MTNYDRTRTARPNEYADILERAYQGGADVDFSNQPEWGTGSDVTVPYTRWGERGYGYDRTRGPGVQEWHVPGPYSGVGPKDYRRSDTRILDDVVERLTENGDLDATYIRVSVRDGIVTLEGNVDRRPSKRLAEDIAESVSGVDDIQNRLTVGQIS